MRAIKAKPDDYPDDYGLTEVQLRERELRHIFENEPWTLSREEVGWLESQSLNGEAAPHHRGNVFLFMDCDDFHNKMLIDVSGDIKHFVINKPKTKLEARDGVVRDTPLSEAVRGRVHLWMGRLSAGDYLKMLWRLAQEDFPEAADFAREFSAASTMLVRVK